LRTSSPFLWSLTLLLGAPLLGAGSHAQAGYMTPGFPGVRPQASPFLGAALQPGAEELGGTAGPDEGRQETAQQHDPRQDQQTPHSLLRFGQASFDHSSGGAGAQGPPGGPGGGGSSKAPAAASLPQTDAPTLVGIVYLESGSRRPPPFPSRLFRPPRALALPLS
jgi:hypothetical protein